MFRRLCAAVVSAVVGLVSELIIVGKLIWLISGLSVADYAEGVGAYYAPGVMLEVCERRMRNGWIPDGRELACDHSCLVSAIAQEDVGAWFLVDVPGASMHY